MIYSVWHTTKFKRQYRKLIRSNPNLVKDLDFIVSLLVDQKILPDRNRNHKLYSDLF